MTTTSKNSSIPPGYPGPRQDRAIYIARTRQTLHPVSAQTRYLDSARPVSGGLAAKTHRPLRNSELSLISATEMPLPGKTRKGFQPGRGKMEEIAFFHGLPNRDPRNHLQPNPNTTRLGEQPRITQMTRIRGD